MNLPILLASATIAASTSAQTVPVVSVEPIVRNEVVTVHSQTCHQAIDNSNSIVGGIVGGIIGSQIGQDESTRRAMTGVGAIIGSQAVQPGYVTRCSPSYSQQTVPTVVGYNVTYIFNGVRHSTVMSYNPGSHVTVQPSHTVR